MPGVGKGPSRTTGACLAVLCLHLNLACLALLLSQLEMEISLTCTAPLTNTAFLVSTISHPLPDRRYHTILASTAFLSVYHHSSPPSPWALIERGRLTPATQPPARWVDGCPNFCATPQVASAALHSLVSTASRRVCVTRKQLRVHGCSERRREVTRLRKDGAASPKSLPKVLTRY